MAIRRSSAVWKGNLKAGAGVMHVGTGVFDGPYTFASRFEEDPGTNPEELLGAAHAGFFSMFLADILATDSYTVRRIATTATVHLVGATITLIELDTEGEVAGIDEAEFVSYAEKAKVGCPVSKALAAVEMHLAAKLVR